MGRPVNPVIDAVLAEMRVRKPEEVYLDLANDRTFCALAGIDYKSSGVYTQIREMVEKYREELGS